MANTSTLMRLVSVFGSLCVVLVLFGCKQRLSTSKIRELEAVENASPERNFVIVLAQGFYSCTYSYNGAKGLVSAAIEAAVAAVKAQKHADNLKANVTVIETCYSGGVLQPSIGQGIETLFYSITEPDSTEGPSRQSNSQAVAQLVYERTRTLSDEGARAKVIMVGHSHGGWLVMKLARDWRNDGDLSMLATIDPISQVNCTQGALIYQNALRTAVPFGALLANAECHRAPRDLEPYAAIARKASQWKHFYQTTFPPLHSGPIAEAQPNENVNSGGAIAHNTILSNPHVWNIISTGIRSAVEAAFADFPDNTGNPEVPAS